MNRLLCAILLLLMICPIAAQDAAPFPVLDEAAIFADGVTVIERLPVLSFNDELRELYYFNPELDTWEAYPYPSELDFLVYISQTPFADGTYLLFRSSYLLPIHATPENIWLFDPMDRIIRHPYSSQIVCGVFPIHDVNIISQETWIVDELNQQLCNTVTGETASLPTDETWYASYDLDFCCPILSTTSNDQYVVLGDYTYDIALQEWRYLGHVNVLTNGVRDVSLINHLVIITAHSPILQSYYGEYAGTSNLLIADARRENSMIHITELPHNRGTGVRQMKSYAFDGQARFVWGDIWDERLVFIEYSLENESLTLLYSGGRPVTNPYQAGHELPINIYLNPENHNILGFETSEGFKLLDLETEEIIGHAIRFERWLGVNRYLAWQNDFLYDYGDISDLKWFVPPVRFQPSPVSPDNQYLLVGAFGEDVLSHYMQIVDLATRQVIPYNIVLKQTENTTFFWTWQNDNTLITELRQDHNMMGRWHIRIDALDEDNS